MTLERVTILTPHPSPASRAMLRERAAVGIYDHVAERGPAGETYLVLELVTGIREHGLEVDGWTIVEEAHHHTEAELRAFAALVPLRPQTGLWTGTTAERHADAPECSPAPRGALTP